MISLKCLSHADKFLKTVTLQRKTFYSGRLKHLAKDVVELSSVKSQELIHNIPKYDITDVVVLKTLIADKKGNPVEANISRICFDGIRISGQMKVGGEPVGKIEMYVFDESVEKGRGLYIDFMKKQSSDYTKVAEALDRFAIHESLNAGKKGNVYLKAAYDSNPKHYSRGYKPIINEFVKDNNWLKQYDKKMRELFEQFKLTGEQAFCDNEEMYLPKSEIIRKIQERPLELISIDK